MAMKRNSVKRVREIMNISRAELARLLGISRGAITNYEFNRRSPSIHIAKKIILLAKQRNIYISLEDVYF